MTPTITILREVLERIVEHCTSSLGRFHAELVLGRVQEVAQAALTAAEDRPCPFCGGPADSFTVPGGAIFVSCKNRDCFHRQNRIGGMTPEDWNTRAHPTPDTGRADVIEASLREFLRDVEYARSHGVNIIRLSGQRLKNIENLVLRSLSPVDTGAGVEADDDPSADERWQAGLDFAMEQLCSVLRVDPEKVRWDAATETLDGDVSAVIGNILRVKYGEDFDPRATNTPVDTGEMERMRLALEQIAAIENQDFGGDWDEIEQAREIARAALAHRGSGG